MLKQIDEHFFKHPLGLKEKKQLLSDTQLSTQGSILAILQSGDNFGHTGHTQLGIASKEDL